MGRIKPGQIILVGVVLGGAAFLFGTKTGGRLREQLTVAADRLPDMVKGIADQVDVDEIAGVLAERAIAELRPAILELLGQKK